MEEKSINVLIETHKHEENPYHYLPSLFCVNLFQLWNLSGDKKVRVLVPMLTKWRKRTDAWRMAVQQWMLKGLMRDLTTL